MRRKPAKHHKHDVFKYVPIFKETEQVVVRREKPKQKQTLPKQLTQKAAECVRTVKQLKIWQSRTPSVAPSDSVFTFKVQQVANNRDRKRILGALENAGLLTPPSTKHYGQLASPPTCKQVLSLPMAPQTSLCSAATTTGQFFATSSSCVSTPKRTEPGKFDFSRRPSAQPLRKEENVLRIEEQSQPSTPPTRRPHKHNVRQMTFLSRPATENAFSLLSLKKCEPVVALVVPSQRNGAFRSTIRPSLFKTTAPDQDPKPGAAKLIRPAEAPQIRTRSGSVSCLFLSTPPNVPQSTLLLPTDGTRGGPIEKTETTSGTTRPPQEQRPISRPRMTRMGSTMELGSRRSPDRLDPRQVAQHMLTRGLSVRGNLDGSRCGKSALDCSSRDGTPSHCSNANVSKAAAGEDSGTRVPHENKWAVLVEDKGDGSRSKRRNAGSAIGTPRSSPKRNEGKDTPSHRRHQQPETGQESPSPPPRGKMRRSDSVVAALEEKYRTYGSPAIRRHEAPAESRLERKVTSLAEKRHVWKGENGVFNRQRLNGWYKCMQHQ